MEQVLQVGDQSWDLPWQPKRTVQMDDVVGTWEIYIESPDGTVFEPTMKISKNGNEYKSVYTSMQGQVLDVRDCASRTTRSSSPCQQISTATH